MSDYGEFVAHRIMPDGKLAAVVALTFDRGRITIGAGEGTYDRSW